MQNTHLIGLLRSFSAYEMNGLRKFVNSTYFNKNKNFSGLFTIISRYYPFFESDELRKETVFRKLFPEKTYRDKTMRNLTYGLLKLTEEFLGLEAYKKDGFSTQGDILESLMEKKYMPLIEKKLRRLKSEITINKYSASKMFYNEYLLLRKKNVLRLHIKETPHKFVIIEDPGEPALMFIFDVLTASFHEQKVNKSAYNITGGYSLITDFMKFFDINGFVESAKKNHYRNLKSLVLYRNMITMTSEPEKTQGYFETVKALDDYMTSLNKYNFANLLIFLESYCIERIIAGDENFNMERFRLNRFIFENRLYGSGEGTYLDYVQFHSAFNSAIKVKKYKWAEEHINKYSAELNPEIKAEVVNYCMAVLSFYKKDYGKCLEIISMFIPDDPYFKMGTRDLLLKIYYEKEHFESALNTIDSYRHFVKRSKTLSPVRKKNILKYLKISGMLIKLRSAPEKHDLANAELIKNEIISSPGLIQKDWLFEKTDELLIEFSKRNPKNK